MAFSFSEPHANHCSLDAIALNKATNVWIDHVDVSSDVAHDKDYYDGLIDVTHACDWVTISNSYIHDHWKSSLVGHSDSNESEDKGMFLRPTNPHISLAPHDAHRDLQAT